MVERCCSPVSCDSISNGSFPPVFGGGRWAGQGCRIWSSAAAAATTGGSGLDRISNAPRARHMQTKPYYCQLPRLATPCIMQHIAVAWTPCRSLTSTRTSAQQLLCLCCCCCTCCVPPWHRHAYAEASMQPHGGQTIAWLLQQLGGAMFTPPCTLHPAPPPGPSCQESWPHPPITSC